MKNTIIRYFPYFRDTHSGKHRLLFLTFSVPLAGFLTFTLLFFLFDDQLVYYYKDQSQLFEKYYLYLLPMVASILYFEVLNSYVRALQDSVTGSFLNEIVMRFLIIVLLLFHWYGMFNFMWFMAFFVLVNSLQPMAMLIYLVTRGELSLSLPFRSDSRVSPAKMAAYGLYTMLSGLTTLLVGNIDIIMLGAMTNLANTAIYAIAFYVGSVIEIPKRAIAKITTPILSGLMKEQRYREVEHIYVRTSINQAIAGSLLLVGIWANLHNLMDILPNEYQGMEWIIIVIGSVRLFDMTTGMNNQIIVHSDYYRFDLYTTLFLVIITAITNYLFIPIYGILGAALATAISLFIYNTIKLIFIWIKFSMQPFRWNTLGILTIAILCLWLSFQIPYIINFIVDVTVRSLAITTVFLSLILLFDLSDDVKHLMIEGQRHMRTLLNG